MALIEEDICSAMPDAPRLHQYDQKAAVYDFLAGSRVYNRLVWGSSPAQYAAFARGAVYAPPRGPLLDAGRPRSVAELNGLIESALRQSPNITTAGNMAYLAMSNG